MGRMMDGGVNQAMSRLAMAALVLGICVASAFGAAKRNEQDTGAAQTDWRPLGALGSGGGEIVRVRTVPSAGADGREVNLVYAMPGLRAAKKTRHVPSAAGGAEVSEELTEVVLGNAPSVGDPGKPVLPVVPCYIALPAGTTLSDLHVSPGREVKIPGVHVVRHGQNPVPLAPGAKAGFVPRDPSVYGSDDPWPPEKFEIVGVQKKRGVSILVVNLNPVVYHPKSGTLACHDSMSVSVTVQPCAATDDVRYRRDPVRPAESMVDNPEALTTYESVSGEVTGAVTGICDPGQTFRYVVVTSRKIARASTSPNINDFVARKQAYGLTTAVVTMENILANYTGVDSAEKLRNFLKDAYSNWGTDFVLLAGDSSIIPRRYVYADGDIFPSDIYYQCLDGTYNSDNDSRWGESTDGPGGTDVDLLSDVYVGRASVEDPVEFSNFVYKTLAHEDYSDGESHLQKALLVAEAIYYDGSETVRSMEDIRLGGSTSGYITAGFAACPEISVERLYDYPAGWEGNPTRYIWPKEEILWRLQSNAYGIISHLGHSNMDYNMRIYSPDVDGLTNNKCFFLYGAGCLAGSFVDDCIAEHWTTSTRHGAFATVHNSIEVWSGNVWGEAEGPTERMMRQFWNGYFGRLHFSLGAMHADSREDNVWCIGRTGMRLTFYASNLFGDPHVALRGQPAAPPFLSLVSVSAGDAAPGGNGDGVVNPGESVSLVATLRNSRLSPAADVVATLSSTNSYVTVTTATATFGTVPGMNDKAGLAPFVFSVSPSCPMPCEVAFDLHIVASSNGPWAESFRVSVLASSPIAGQVANVSDGAGIAGASVIFRGPISGTATAAADGSYMFGGPDGTYTLVAKAPGYFDSAPVDVTLPPGQTGVDFALSRATIEVSPQTVSIPAAEGGSTSAVVSVGNEGDATLAWKTASGSTKGDPVAQFDIPPDLLDPYGYVSSTMAYDGRFLWLGDASDYSGAIRKIDPATGAEVGSLSLSAGYASDLCWDDGKFWALSGTNILCVDSVSGATLKTIPCVGYTAYSLGEGDGALWMLTSTKTIKKVSAETGTLLASFSLPSQILAPSCVVFFNGNIWVMSPVEGYGIAYKLNAANGSLLDSVPIPGSQLGYSSCEILSAAHDSLQHLWFVIRSRGPYPRFAQKVLVMDTGEFTWLKGTPASGSIPSGGSQDVTITMDAGALKAGTYEASLVLESNDTATPSRTISVTFEVADVDPDDDNDGMPDAWETANGLNPKNAEDAARTRMGTG